MAATNFTPISLYYSTTASAVPTAANLVPGELAINTADGKLYYEDSSGVVQTLASKAGALGDVVGPASATDNALARFDLTTGKLIQNSVGILSDAGILTGLTGLTSSGSITFSSLTSGRVPYATTAGLLTDSANLLYSGTDLTVYGLTVGRGAGAVDGNTAVGSNALVANTSGGGNTSIGYYSLRLNAGGANNTSVGGLTLYSNTSGSGNVAVGYNSLRTATTASNNTATGSNSMYSNTTGASNVAYGVQALYTNSSGGSNTAIGQDSLFSNTTASNNTAVGYQAGYSNTTGAGNTFFGYTAGTAVTTGSNLTVIGNTAAASAVGATNEITLGNSSIATLRCQVTTITALSDSRDKENIQELQAGLDFVNKLKPVSFDWNMRDGGKVGIADTGFIAQDLKQVQVDTGITIPDLVYEENPERLEAGYGKLLPILVKAIQELKAEVDSLKQQLGA